MQSRPPRPPTGVIGPAPGAGHKSPAPKTSRSDDEDEELPLPHERDQQPKTGAPRPRGVIEQAAKDIESGQVDTDLRSGGGLDEERRKELLKRGR